MQLTIRQAAELLQASESQVRRWIRDGGLPAVLFNEQYRLNHVDLMVWAQQHQLTVKPPAPAPHADDLLVAALRRGGIHRGIVGATCAEVVRAAVAALLLPPAVDRDLLLEMIAARQSHGTTAIGHGVAIPHARYPIVSAVPESIAGLCLLQAPVHFAAPDGVPVAALFVLVTPTPRAHLELLAALSRALGGPLLPAVQEQAADEVLLAAARTGAREP